jgi:hypothetical protein
VLPCVAQDEDSSERTGAAFDAALAHRAEHFNKMRF